MAALTLDEKCLVLLDINYFWVLKNATGYHPWPAVPSTTADEDPFIWLELTWNEREEKDLINLPFSKILEGPSINCAGIQTQGFLDHSLDIVFYLASPILNFPPFLCLFFSKDATNRFFSSENVFCEKNLRLVSIDWNFFLSWIRFWRKIGDNSFWWKAELAKDWIPLTF